MLSRQELLESIATRLADYREGEVSKPTPEHVEQWTVQFDQDVQEPMLAELDYVFERTYFSKGDVLGDLGSLAIAPKLVGPDPAAFRRDCTFLKIHEGGYSQADMLAMFDKVLGNGFGRIG